MKRLETVQPATSNPCSHNLRGCKWVWEAEEAVRCPPRRRGDYHEQFDCLLLMIACSCCNAERNDRNRSPGPVHTSS
eukprot:960634-Rhodomonas_salina.7